MQKDNIQNIHGSLAEDVSKAVGNGDVDGALDMLDKAVADGESAEAYYLRGRLKWKLGMKTEAMGDYSKAAAIDPSSPAVAALELARDVMDFFNHDLYNP